MSVRREERRPQMSLRRWIGSNATYARKLANSGWEGASQGREEFLDGERLTPFITDSVTKALKPATAGVCLGLASAYLTRTRKPAARVLAFGMLGGAIGFGAGLLWKTRHLTVGAARGAIKKTGPVRDERWFEK